MTTHNGPFIIPIKYYSFTVILFLLVLGSHHLNYYPQFFIILALFLVDRRKFYSKEVLILVTFLVSIYATLLFLDRDILYDLDKFVKVSSQFLMLFLAYMLGLSLRYIPFSKGISNQKFIFYIFFGFFLGEI